jgi:Lrp/AsnC family leucine-responsive transcriptional regulator
MIKIDKFDIAILCELQRDSRISHSDLAEKVGLSTAPCWRRIKAMEKSGLIKCYRAELDRQKLGLGVLAFVRLDAERNSGDVTRELEDRIRDIPEIVSCHYISGIGTFELQVIAQDLEAFSHFARHVLLNLPHVKDMQTSFSLGEVKSSQHLPLGHLAANSGRPIR